MTSHAHAPDAPLSLGFFFLRVVLGRIEAHENRKSFHEFRRALSEVRTPSFACPQLYFLSLKKQDLNSSDTKYDEYGLNFHPFQKK